ARIAAVALPAWLNASFRPTRLVKALGPVMPSVIAAMAGGNPAAARPITALQDATTQKRGAIVMVMQPTAMTSAAITTRPRLNQEASMQAPAGVCAATVATPMMVMTRPMLASFQC